jgi:hypothetical protein
MDITNAKPPLIHAESSGDLPEAISPAIAPITPLDLIEGTKIRTKLRLYAILFALYVTLADPMF